MSVWGQYITAQSVKGDWLTFVGTKQQSIKVNVILESWARFSAKTSLKESVMRWLSQRLLAEVDCVRPKGTDSWLL